MFMNSMLSVTTGMSGTGTSMTVCMQKKTIEEELQRKEIGQLSLGNKKLVGQRRMATISGK
jgi:hypothetical protein